MKNTLLTFASLLAISCSLAGCSHAQTSAAPHNIAIGKDVSVSPQPKYGLMQSDDPAQLTDGKFAAAGKQLWTQLGAITWSYVNPVTITVDLGSVQPISGVSYSTATNAPSRIYLPESILVAVSEDNKNWYYVGDLIKSSQQPSSKAKGYAAFQYKTTGWKTKGRYVSFGITQKTFTVTDEIQVFRGQDAWLQESLSGTPFSSMKELAQQETTTRFVRERIAEDISRVRDVVRESSLSAVGQKVLFTQLDQGNAALKDMPLLPADFKTIFPFNDIHRTAFGVYGKLLEAEGVAPLTIWQQQRYQWLPLFAKPIKSNPQLRFSMLGNQHRSDAVLITNASADPMTVTLAAKNIPQNAKAGWLKVAQVEFTDTIENVAVADALVPISPDETNHYSITVPAGMTRKVWFTVDSSLVPAGKYQSNIMIKSPTLESTIPMSLQVADLDMTKPRLALTMWDYSAAASGKPSAVTEQNQPEILAMMNSHYVDTAWSNEWGVRFGSLITAKDFDANNKLINADFSRLKQWREKWPDAHRYFVYLGSVATKPEFAGAKMGTPEFNARLGNWAKALMANLPEIGLKPDQFALCIVDEAKSEEQDAIIEGWAKAIKAATPELQIFSDPMWRAPETNKNQAALQLPDIICVKPNVYYKGTEETRRYFQSLQKQGTDLWFYQCSGPARLFDPQYYHRGQAWLAFAAGAKGQGFWSFTDAGHAVSSWNEYGISRQTYAPAFIDKDSVNSSLHWEAVRDGMQDNEELSMLRDAIAQCKDIALKAKAQKVLDEAVQMVVNDWQTSSGVTSADAKELPRYRAEIDKYRNVTTTDWRLKHDVTMADMQAARVREMLIEIRGK